MGKNYWFKMPFNFFKRHDIRLLRAVEEEQDENGKITLPDGDTLTIIFLVLLCEAQHHDGYLRYSVNLPYSLDDLTVICDLNSNGSVTRYVTPLRNVMRNVMQTLRNRGLVTVDEKGTIFIPLSQELIGTQKEDTTNAERQRRYREKKKSQGLQGLPSDTDSNGKVTRYVTESNALRNGVTVTESKSKNKSKNKSYISKEKDIEKENGKSSRFVPPTVDEVKAYCESRCNGIDAQEFVDFYESRNWISGKTKIVDWKACVRTWEARRKKGTASYMDYDYTPEQMASMKRSTLSDLKKLLKKPDDVPIMENEYDLSPEAIKKREEQDGKLLDDLLEEET